ncbi:hypothetical protein PMZ84_14785 [[Clostridium] symbiosum]|uniref:hypothetical protein n=1 Tax=Clostridium symbiosum TaxID=1512 RepID=UPI0008230F87|nr:hypothetical protein [[Clostridium] symbiosum]MDB2032482.1 hypothetical protein [[Clostridium] symbiosum]SCJ21724.1 Uncharacterised protein [uncultured Clostridium sp.]
MEEYIYDSENDDLGGYVKMDNRATVVVNDSNSKDIKIKVTSAEIVVHGSVEKPYYEIKYHEVGGSEYHIGYSSYNLNNVFEWLKECFEIVNTDEQQN